MEIWGELADWNRGGELYFGRFQELYFQFSLDARAQKASRECSNGPYVKANIFQDLEIRNDQVPRRGGDEGETSDRGVTASCASGFGESVDKDPGD